MKLIYYRARRKLCHLLGDCLGVSKWTTRIRSAAVIGKLKRNFGDSILPDIEIELNNDCNYACHFCPQSSFRRPVQYMTRQSFLQVVGMLKRMPYKRASIVLSINNEPLLHPLFFEFCEIVSRELPAFSSWFVTNGSLLTEQNILYLSKLDRPPGILIDDYTPDQNIARRINEIMTRQGEVLCVKREDDVNTEKVHYKLHGKMGITVWQRAVNADLSNRAGNQVVRDTSRVREHANIVCTHPFTSICIAPNLRTFLCCCDYRCECETGDLSRQSIIDIWNSPDYRDIRKKMLKSQRRNLPLCKRCDFEWFLGWRFEELP